MTKLILIRHGQSLGNLFENFLGHTDLDLSELGYKQAEITAEYLKNEQIDAVYSSDLIRAYNTVLPIAKQRGLDVIKDDGLREIYAGVWEGKSYSELLNTYPVEYGIWLNDIGNARCNGGESVTELQKRIVNRIIKIAKENPSKTVCIGTHATPLRVLNAYINNIGPSKIKEIPWATNASVTIVNYDNEKMTMLDYSNDSFMEKNATALPNRV